MLPNARLTCTAPPAHTLPSQQKQFQRGGESRTRRRDERRKEEESEKEEGHRRRATLSAPPTREMKGKRRRSGERGENSGGTARRLRTSTANFWLSEENSSPCIEVTCAVGRADAWRLGVRARLRWIVGC
ncbi:hypothetical protein U1Q18_004529 [Sarracenia purpurea var. burkii]